MLVEAQERLSIAAGSPAKVEPSSTPAPSPGRSTRSESGRGTKGVRASVASSIVSIGGNAIAGVVNYLFAVFLGEGTALARRDEGEDLLRGAAELPAERRDDARPRDEDRENGRAACRERW